MKYSYYNLIGMDIYIPYLLVYKPHFFPEILGSKSQVRLIHETIAFRGSTLASMGSQIVLKIFSK